MVALSRVLVKPGKYMFFSTIQILSISVSLSADVSLLFKQGKSFLCSMIQTIFVSLSVTFVFFSKEGVDLLLDRLNPSSLEARRVNSLLDCLNRFLICSSSLPSLLRMNKWITRSIASIQSHLQVG
jgi:hypothetical protein